MTKLLYKGLFCTLLLAYTSSSLADEAAANFQVLLQNLIVTDVVYPQGKGQLQAYTGVSYFNSTGEQDTLIPLFFAYGITENLQLGLSANTLLFHNVTNADTFSAVDSVTLGAEYSIMNINNSYYHMGLVFNYEYPTGNINNGINDGFAVYEPAVILAKDFPNLHYSQLFSEVGFNFVQRIKQSDIPDNNQPIDHDVFVNLGYFFPVGKARYDLEVNWINGQWNHQGTDNELYITPGIILELTDTVEIDLGCSVGLTPSSDNVDIIFRISYSN
jgi:hypothetical protein